MLNIPRPTQGEYAEKPKVSKTPAIIATATSGVLLALTAAAYWRFDSLANSAASDGGFLMGDFDKRFQRDQERIERTHRWMKISLGMFATTVISSAVTGYLWSRHDNPGPSVGLEPTNSGVMFQFYRPLYH